MSVQFFETCTMTSHTLSVLYQKRSLLTTEIIRAINKSFLNSCVCSKNFPPKTFFQPRIFLIPHRLELFLCLSPLHRCFLWQFKLVSTPNISHPLWPQTKGGKSWIEVPLGGKFNPRYTFREMFLNKSVGRVGKGVKREVSEIRRSQYFN